MTGIASKPAARRGRPPLPPEERKRYPLNTRTTKDLHDKLKVAAGQSGRSLAQETEFRLEQSLRDEEARYESFGGRHNYSLMQVLGSAIAAAETIKGTTWVEDLDLFREVRSIVLTILVAYEIAVRESPSPSRADERPGLKDVLAALSGQQSKKNPGDNPLVPLAKAIRGSLIEMGGKQTADTRHVERPSTPPKKRRKSPGRATKGKRDLDLG